MPQIQGHLPTYNEDSFFEEMEEPTYGDPGYQSGSSILDQLDPDLVNELLEEMQQVHDTCASDGLQSRFYDCECLAVQYLDKRLEMGPEASNGKIMMQINKECANPVGVAGYSYGVCEERMILMNRPDFKSVCECFANTVAKTYGERPRLESRYWQRVQAYAYTQCGYVKRR